MKVLIKTTPVSRALAGFTLLEVLIAVLVLSVGLLGLAGLQATGIKANHSAYMRSQAVAYGYDIIDRMRANRLSALSGGYNIAIGAGAPAGSSIAQSDLREWKTLVAAHLPVGDASANVNGGTVTVVVQWDDSRAEGSTTQTITVQTEL
jgi:type IV pilus assembly protein PilV